MVIKLNGTGDFITNNNYKYIKNDFFLKNNFKAKYS